jgi:hypothetical protein
LCRFAETDIEQWTQTYLTSPNPAIYRGAALQQITGREEPLNSR